MWCCAKCKIHNVSDCEYILKVINQQTKTKQQTNKQKKKQSKNSIQLKREREKHTHGLKIVCENPSTLTQVKYFIPFLFSIVIFFPQVLSFFPRIFLWLFDFFKSSELSEEKKRKTKKKYIVGYITTALTKVSYQTWNSFI